MHRLVEILVFGICLCFGGQAKAQVVFKGPDTTKTNKMTTITLDKIDGDDLKLQAFYNGKPADGSDYLLMKNFTDQTVIFIMTDKVGVFTFIAGVNKGGKTYVSNFTLDVVSNTAPTPTQTFSDKIKSLYRVSPDTNSLNRLITILDEVSAQDYKSYDDMETVLTNTGQKYLPNDELRSVRDAISSEILARCGDDSRKRDISKVRAVYQEASQALKQCK